jgi:orotate phosphoribosyltransferase
MDLKDVLIREKIVKIKGEGEELFTLKSGKKSRLFIDIVGVQR